jgi:hypothetical protein
VNVLSLPADLILRGNLLRCLQIGLSSAAVVELPGTAGFAEDSTRYSVLEAPTFRAVVRVASEGDIATCVRPPTILFQYILKSCESTRTC